MLWRLVQRDGVETVRRIIIHDYFGWSIIDADQQAEARHMIHEGSSFVSVPGYGVAYTAPPVSEQSHEDDWYGPHEKWGTVDHEWAYVLGDSSMLVLKCHFDSAPPTLLATVDYDGDEPDWSAIEQSAYQEA